MKKILLVSDTHSYLDDTILKYVKGSDITIHAGDLGSEDIIDTIKKYTFFIGVYGNIDDHQIRSTLKENEIINIENHKFLITHIAGKCPNYNKKVKKLISDEKPQILIYGHSHLLKVEYDKKNQLTVINPGAAGKHGFHRKRTMIRFKISKSGLSDMEIIELGERGKLS
ncbi:MAG: metallophosphoesterase [Cryomorphaceae bacterium]|nr:MAG: metallophosphoesterase [Cryomorphaceae bacterium]